VNNIKISKAEFNKTLRELCTETRKKKWKLNKEIVFDFLDGIEYTYNNPDGNGRNRSQSTNDRQPCTNESTPHSKTPSLNDQNSNSNDNTFNLPCQTRTSQQMDNMNAFYSDIHYNNDYYQPSQHQLQQQQHFHLNQYQQYSQARSFNYQRLPQQTFK
jgi:hypothetical protein